MDNTLNTFTKGMIKDVAETLRPEQSYEDAQDMKLNAGSSASEYIISNVKGNNLSFTLPDVPVLFTVNIKDISLPTNWSETITITTSSLGTFTGNTFYGLSSDKDDYLDKIQESILEDPIFASLNLNVARSGSRIRIWSNDISITNIQLSYSSVKVQQIQTDQQIIGWDVSNDVIVLFTTNDSSATGGIGSLWKLTYDKVTFDTTIKIIYSDDIKFTTRQPIANPGGVEMVYERPSIHRIYWTDRMNNLRSFNIDDPNVMALDPDIIDIDTSVILQSPYLKNIAAGSGLLAGHYQFSYYLESSSGAITPYAPASNSIFITDYIPNNSTVGYNEYKGAAPETEVGVSIEIEISNVDSSFDLITLIVIKKIIENASPIIEMITASIQNQSTIRYVYDGNSEVALINEIDFLAFRNTFDICHTIAQKDNILFAANTIGKPFDIDFDTRAYRFNNIKEHDLRYDNGDPISISPLELLDISDPFALDRTSDAINNDQYVYKYQYTSDSNGNPVIGGQGPNIKYKFTNRKTHSDDRSLNNGAYPYRLPYPSGLFTEDLGTGIDYDVNFYQDHKSPYVNHIFRGYRRGETYRFAWVPVKNGVEGYARWIADIQMPEIYEDVFTSNDPNQETFITGDQRNTYQLGVEFTVAIPSEISVLIDSYKIKRVKLLPNQRTVLAQGVLQQTAAVKTNNGNGLYIDVRYYTPILGDSSWQIKYVNPWLSNNVKLENVNNGFDQKTLNLPIHDEYNELVDTYNYATFTQAWNYIGVDVNGVKRYETQKPFCFHSPDFLFGRPIGHQNGDKIRLIAGLKQQDGDTGNSGSVNAVGGYQFWKLNNLTPLPDDIQNKEIEVTDALFMLKHSLNPNPINMNNYEFEISNKSNPLYYTVVPQTAIIRSDGSSTTAITLDKAIRLIQDANYTTGPFTNNSFATTGWLPGDPETYIDEVVLTSLSGTSENLTGTFKVASRPDKILANYMRDVPNQYGGKSYSARASNIYISTGTEVSTPIDNLTKTFKVYGGDTFVNVFDTLKMTKNYSISNFRPLRAAVGLWFPVESFINTDLRGGDAPNNTLQEYGNPSGYLDISADATGIPNAEDFPLDIGGETFKYNYVYSEEMDLQRSFPLPLTLIENDLIYPTRIWASNVKVYGEENDSWRVFDSEKYLDIQGNFGEIRQLVTNNNTLYAWQENGFGVVSVNERALTADQAGSGVILGKSGVLPRFDYLSESIGSWHQFSFATSPNGVLFFDRKDGGLYLFGSQGLRDVSAGKVNSWLYKNTRGFILQNDAPTGQVSQTGISSTYDYVNKEFLITFFDRPSSPGTPFLFTIPFTLAYSDIADVFTSFRSFCPNMYINDNKNLLTPKPFSIPSEVYVHEQGDYGVFYDKDPSTSSITTVVNKEPFITKIFDNIRWLTEVFLPDGTEVSDETFSSIETFNTYQTTGVKTVFKRLMREWKHAIQYQIDTKNRIRSHYVRQKFEFLNNNNKEFRLHYLMNLFRKIMK
jgi:hypothetical protein